MQKVTAKSDPLTPAGPKRTAAHSRSGSGVYMSAGMWLASEMPMSNPAAASPSTRIVASVSRLASGRRNQARLQLMPSTRIGVTTSTVSALLAKRMAHAGQ
jgi:hypothetical protein